jgi:hypothetical protein
MTEARSRRFSRNSAKPQELVAGGLLCGGRSEWLARSAKPALPSDNGRRALRDRLILAPPGAISDV